MIALWAGCLTASDFSCRRSTAKPFSSQRAILGTHTSEDEPNYLVIAEIKFPLEADQPFYESM